MQFGLSRHTLSWVSHYTLLLSIAGAPDSSVLLYWVAHLTRLVVLSDLNLEEVRVNRSEREVLSWFWWELNTGHRDYSGVFLVDYNKTKCFSISKISLGLIAGFYLLGILSVCTPRLSFHPRYLNTMVKSLCLWSFSIALDSSLVRMVCSWKYA